MKLSEEELSHIIFLSGMIVENKKRNLMEDTAQCLLYLVKSMREADLPEGVCEEIRERIARMEAQLKQENDRMHEIRQNLSANKKI